MKRACTQFSNKQQKIDKQDFVSHITTEHMHKKSGVSRSNNVFIPIALPFIFGFQLRITLAETQKCQTYVTYLTYLAFSYLTVPKC